jgi:hypothetical protein
MAALTHVAAADRALGNAITHFLGGRCLAGVLAWQAGVFATGQAHAHLHSALGVRGARDGALREDVRRLQGSIMATRQLLRTDCLLTHERRAAALAAGDIPREDAARWARDNVRQATRLAREGDCGNAAGLLRVAANTIGRGGFGERIPGSLRRAIRAIDARCLRRDLAPLPKRGPGDVRARDVLEIDGVRTRRRRRR